MNRARPHQIVIRVNEKELEEIKNKVKKSNLTQNEYLIRSALNKEIVVVNGLKDITTELKRVGNNLNQITKSIHQGKVNCDPELNSINEEMKKIWQSLKQLTQKQV